MTEHSTALPDISDAVFVGRPIDQLSALIVEQSQELFNQLDIVIPVRSCSLITAIGQLGPASASDLAAALGQSHQLILQKLPKLLKLGLIERAQDPDDARRKVFSLTSEGTEQLERFAACSDKLRAAYAALFAEVGDISAIAAAAIAALESEPLSERVGVG